MRQTCVFCKHHWDIGESQQVKRPVCLVCELRRLDNHNRPRSRYRGNLEVEYEILAKLYDSGPMKKYRVLCVAMSSYPIFMRVMSGLEKHGLVERVSDIETKEDTRTTDGYAITQRGVKYKDKAAQLLRMLGVEPRKTKK